MASFKNASSIQDRKALLAWRHSNWVNQHLHLLFQAPKLRKTDLFVDTCPLKTSALTILQKDHSVRLGDDGIPERRALRERQGDVAEEALWRASNRRRWLAVSVH